MGVNILIPTQKSNQENRRERAPWIPQDERLFSAWNIGFVLVGVLLFLIGTGIQLVTPRYPELNHLVIACLRPSANPQSLLADCRTAVFNFDQIAHRAEAVNVPLLISELLRALGSGLFLAVIISVTIERQNRGRFMNALTGKTRELSLSVFTGMFNRQHPEALLDAVKSQILERDLIRDSLSVTYTLSIWRPDPSCVRLVGRSFVKVDVILATSIRNVSTLKGEDAGVALVPLGLALPNPMLDELKPHVRVSKFHVGGNPIQQATIDEENAKLQAAMADDDAADVGIDFGSHAIQPGESLRVSANYTMMKELEDTEVFRTLQISQSLSLTVVDNTDGQLLIRAKAIHSSNLERMGSGGATTQWRLSDIILPQQGIMVWWKAPVLAQKDTGSSLTDASG